MRISGGGPKLNIRATVSVQTPGIEAFTSGITYALGNLALAARGRSSLSAQLGNDANRPPVWSGFPQTLVVFQGGGAVNLNSYCTDPDGDPVTYRSIGAALPAGVILTSQGMLSAASDAAIGTTATCIFEASDGRGGIANSPSFTLAVHSQTSVPLVEVDLAYAPARRYRQLSANDQVSQSWATVTRRADDTVITWGGQSHGASESNEVRLFDPVTKTHVNITADTARIPGTNSANWDQPASLWYNNLNYMVIPSTDDFIVFGRNFGNVKKMLDAPSLEDASVQGWTHFQPLRTAGDWPEDNYWVNQFNSGNELPRTVGTQDGSFFLSIGGITPEELGAFNGGLTWNRFLNKGVLIGPIAQGGINPYVYVFERNDASSRFYDPTKPNCKWLVWKVNASVAPWYVGDKWPIRDLSSEIRNQICAKGDWIYFISPKGAANTFSPARSLGWFWKFNLRTLSETGNPQLQECATMPAPFWQARSFIPAATGTFRLVIDAPYTSHQIANYSPQGWWTFINDISFIQDPKATGFDGGRHVLFATSQTTGHKYVFGKERVFDPAQNKVVRTYKGILYRVANYGGSYATAQIPLNDDTYTFEEALGTPYDFGQLVYDESAGYILYLGSIGVWAYDPDDDARGWMQVFEPDQPDKNGIVPYNNNPPAFVSEMQGQYLPSHEMTVARQGGGSINTDKWLSIKILTKKSRQKRQDWMAHFPNPATGLTTTRLWTNKHCKYLWDEHKGYVYQIGGDHAGWPYQSGTPLGFPRRAGKYEVAPYPPGVNPWIHKNNSQLEPWNRSDGARQDWWMLDPEPDSNGVVWWQMSQNPYHNYPFAPNNPTAEPRDCQPGPYAPDGIAAAIDKRGDVWCGLGGRNSAEYRVWTHDDDVALDPRFEMMGDGYYHLYRWRLPDIDPQTGIRLGGEPGGAKGFYKPPQNLLMPPKENYSDIVDPFYDLPRFDANRFGPGIGDLRTMTSLSENSYLSYDPVKDEIVMLTNYWGHELINISIFRCGVGPNRIAGPNGEYLWRRTIVRKRISEDNILDAWKDGYRGMPLPRSVGSSEVVTEAWCGPNTASYCGQSVIVDRHIYARIVIMGYTPTTWRYRTNAESEAQNWTNYVFREFLVKVNLDEENPEMHFIHMEGVLPHHAVEVADRVSNDYRRMNSVAAQDLHMFAINRKIVLCPPPHSVGGARSYLPQDPLLHFYDVDSGKFSAGEALNTSLVPDPNDFNTGWSMFIPMPHMSEVWFVNPTNTVVQLPHIRYRID